MRVRLEHFPANQSRGERHKPRRGSARAVEGEVTNGNDANLPELRQTKFDDDWPEGLVFVLYLVNEHATSSLFDRGMPALPGLYRLELHGDQSAGGATCPSSSDWCGDHHSESAVGSDDRAGGADRYSAAADRTLRNLRLEQRRVVGREQKLMTPKTPSGSVEAFYRRLIDLLDRAHDGEKHWPPGGSMNEKATGFDKSLAKRGERLKKEILAGITLTRGANGGTVINLDEITFGKCKDLREILEILKAVPDPDSLALDPLATNRLLTQQANDFGGEFGDEDDLWIRFLRDVLRIQAVDPTQDVTSFGVPPSPASVAANKKATGYEDATDEMNRRFKKTLKLARGIESTNQLPETFGNSGPAPAGIGQPSPELVRKAFDPFADQGASMLALARTIGPRTKKCR
jgi:hypothetical protein